MAGDAVLRGQADKPEPACDAASAVVAAADASGGRLTAADLRPRSVDDARREGA